MVIYPQSLRTLYNPSSKCIFVQNCSIWTLIDTNVQQGHHRHVKSYSIRSESVPINESDKSQNLGAPKARVYLK